LGIQLGFAEANHKITPIGKLRCGLGLGKLSKMLGFPYNVSATAEASNFKIGMLLGFAKARHKNPIPKKKWTWPCAIGASQNFSVFI